MSNVEKAAALMEGINRRDLEQLSAAKRKNFAAALRRLADIADPPALPARPRAGVLYDLCQGHRSL